MTLTKKLSRCKLHIISNKNLRMTSLRNLINIIISIIVLKKAEVFVT